MLQAQKWGDFPEEEIHWAIHGWARLAPGFGGWKVARGPCTCGLGTALSVIPPSPQQNEALCPKFALAALPTGEAILLADVPGEVLRELGTYASLSEALHALCPLMPSQETEADAKAAAVSGAA